VVATDFTGREIDLYHLGRMAVDGVIRIETDPSARDIRDTVDRAIASALATRVTASLVGTFPGRVLDALRWAIEHAETKPQVSEMAAALATSRRTLAREMDNLDRASPRTILLWGRLIWASYLLERPSETVESVAYRLGYATGGALGKALKRQMGCNPTDLLREGGLTRALDVLRHRGLPSTRHGR
jgi:AraC-like DNA-binding protein